MKGGASSDCALTRKRKPKKICKEVEANSDSQTSSLVGSDSMGGLKFFYSVLKSASEASGFAVGRGVTNGKFEFTICKDLV